MTLRSALARCLAFNLTYGLLIAALMIAVTANTPTVRQGRRRDSNVVECWNPDTAQLSEQVGSCPA